MADLTDAEKIVLESWKRERAELDAAISMMEKKIAARGIGSLSSAFTSGSGHVKADEFFRMTTPVAIKKFLGIVGRPARTTTDIIDGLKSGGLETNYTNVYTALNRLQSKGVVKVGENWGLEEWYPSIPAGPGRLKSILAGLQEDGIPLIDEPAGMSEVKEEQKVIETYSPSRKDEVADFIKKNGPSTRAELLSGTGIPNGTIGYCLKDETRFVKGKDEKWRNVE